jgi:hypothetical protein
MGRTSERKKAARLLAKLRAKSLTPARRSEIARKAGQARIDKRKAGK